MAETNQTQIEDDQRREIVEAELRHFLSYVTGIDEFPAEPDTTEPTQTAA